MHPAPAVAYPLRCVGCGYDLIGLAEDGVCPECGVPIGRSVSGDHLSSSRARYRRVLARGAAAAHAGAVVAWAGLAAGATGYALAGSRPIAAWMAVVPMAATMLLSSWGWLQLTTPDPDGVGEADDSGGMGRLMVRVWAMLVLVAALALLPLAAGIFLLARGPSAVVLGLVLLAALVAGVPALVLSSAMASRVGAIARRLLEGDLADRARGLTVAGYVALALGAIAAGGWALDLPGGWRLLEAPVWLGLGLALLAWGIIYHALVRALAVALGTVAARP